MIKLQGLWHQTLSSKGMLKLVAVDIMVPNVCWFWWWLVLIIANVDFEIYRSLALIKICQQLSAIVGNVNQLPSWEALHVFLSVLPNRDDFHVHCVIGK